MSVLVSQTCSAPPHHQDCSRRVTVGFVIAMTAKINREGNGWEGESLYMERRTLRFVLDVQESGSSTNSSQTAKQQRRPWVCNKLLKVKIIRVLHIGVGFGVAYLDY